MCTTATHCATPCAQQQPTVRKTQILILGLRAGPRRISKSCIWLLSQERLGRGEFNAETTRVLHFVRNPQAEEQRQTAEARIAELDAENGALRSQLQRLESARAATGAAAPDAEPGSSKPGVAAALAEAELAIAQRKVELRIFYIFCSFADQTPPPMLPDFMRTLCLTCNVPACNLNW